MTTSHLAESLREVRRRMAERRLSFKEALNDAIRSSAQPAAAAPPFQTATAAMGESRVNLDRALQIAADLEDDELVRKLRTGS